MKYELDSKTTIARSNVYAIFGKLIKPYISNNEIGEVILKEAGLSAYVDDYRNYLQPYSYYRGYTNPNDGFNPEYACLEICKDIEDNSEALLRFFNTILKRIREIDSELFTELSNYLDVLGYVLLEKEIDERYGGYSYSLVPASDGTEKRDKDLNYLYTMLEQYHPDLVAIYDECISNYGNAEYVSCIDNCRSLFETFFKKLDTSNGEYVKGILNATGEVIIENGSSLQSIKKIYDYWLRNKKGANRFRLFQTEYSVMSGLGVHKEDIATAEDALLLLRFTEDTLLWCFRKGINC